MTSTIYRPVDNYESSWHPQPSPTADEDEYTLIDDETHDSDTTYLYPPYTSSGKYQTSHGITASRIMDTAITSVTVNTYTRRGNTNQYPYFYHTLRTYDTYYYGTHYPESSTSYIHRSETWTTNPYTLAAWTWAEIIALKIGAYGNSRSTWKNGPGSTALLMTQLYVEVEYETVEYGPTDRDEADITYNVGLENRTYYAPTIKQNALSQELKTVSILEENRTRSINTETRIYKIY